MTRCLRTGTEILEQPLITKPGTSSNPVDLDGLRCLRALKLSESEIGAKDKNSEHGRRVGRAYRQRLLYTD
jgi:hypothetical protein